MNELAVIEQTVNAIATTDQWLEIRSKVKFIKDAIKEIDKLIERKGLSLIEQFGDITFGDKRYVIGVDKSYKPQEKPVNFAEDLMTKLGGDWDAFSRCLASGAFKPGQVRTEIEAIHGDETDKVFAMFFRRNEEKFVDEKPVKKIKEIDTRFTRGRKAA